MNQNRVSPPLKWHGGKYYLAQKIVALMPPHLHYVEPYAGGLSVLLTKTPEGISEVVNDLNGGLSNFWKVLQNEEQFARFHRVLQAVPFSQAEWEDAAVEGTDVVDCAVRFFIRCRQSLAGRMDTFAPLSKTRTRRGMNEQASAWISAVDSLPLVHARLRRVSVMNRDALEVIRLEDTTKTLFYLDPPYLAETRTADDVYAHEMGEKAHAELLSTIRKCKGRVMLSGYPSDLYDAKLHDWTRREFALPNQAASGKQKRRMIEVVWSNF